MSMFSAALSAFGLRTTEDEQANAARCVAILRSARTALDNAGRTKIGDIASRFDHVNVSLTREAAAMLMVLIDRELPKID